MNPILPGKHFVPDGEARVMPDGRLYLYGSYDISGEDSYCSDVLHVFSTDNLREWTDHGVCLKAGDIPWAKKESLMYAPDCVHKDGMYYMYFCMSGALEGVARSDSPYGYFKEPVPVKGADGVSIDPAVLVDDDGQVYYFWGQFHLCGGKLKEDMSTLDMETLNTNIIDEKQHGFHEGACIRKRGGLYYLIYTDTSRGRATCLSYAVAEKPLGPYTKKGVIIDNIFCDPKTWNNHGCIVEFKNQWYLFYHRSSQNSEANRRMCIEPVYFDEDGLMKEVEMTTQGSEGPQEAKGKYHAASACQVRNGGYIAPGGDAEGELLTHVKNGSWASYKFFDFSSPEQIEFTASSAVGGGIIEIWADDVIIGSCTVADTGGWNLFQKFTCSIKPVKGARTLYLCFKGNYMYSRLMDVRDFTFV